MGFHVAMHSYGLIYTGIRVRDMDESLLFYTERLGMEVVDKRESTPPTDGEVVILRSPDGTQRLELNWYAEGSRFGPPYSNGEDLDHLGFEVDDLDEALAELSSDGVEVLIRPGEIGGWYGWREAFIKDPNGIWIELLQRKKS
jgi:lactoylglutathione lyase